MNASIVDLRYKTSKILEALEQSEKVNILYHGKVKGIIFPIHETMKNKVSEHPFFGMLSSKKGDTAKKTKQPSVNSVMKNLRGGRHHDL